MKTVTIKTIAEYAGVSRGTVDRVLNSRPHVSPDQQTRVLRAIRDLKYIPSKENQRRMVNDLCKNLPDRIRLGIILPSEGGYFREELCKGIAEAEKLLSGTDAELLVRKCETQMPDEFTGYIDEMSRMGINGLAVCAENDTPIVEAVRSLCGKGTAVVTYNSDLPDSGRAMFIGEDVYAGGRLAANLMRKLIRPGDKLIAAIGNRRVYGHQQRLDGFMDYMTEHGCRPEDIYVTETYNDFTLSRQHISELLDAHPLVRGIYMANHSVGGCVEAIRAAGLSGQIHVISHDLTESARRLLANDETDFVITQDIAAQSRQALLALLNLARTGSASVRDRRYSQMNIVCAENLRSY